MASGEEIGPGVGAFEACAEISEVEAGWIEERFHFGPGERRRDGRVRFAANGIGADDGLDFAVARDVNVNAVSARGQRVFGCEFFRICAGETLGERCGEGEDFVGAGANFEWDENVKAATAGRFGEAAEIERIEYFLDEKAGVGGVAEFSGHGIEIEADPVRLGEILRAAAADVNGNATEIYERELRGERAADNIFRDGAFAVSGGNFFRGRIAR